MNEKRYYILVKNKESKKVYNQFIEWVEAAPVYCKWVLNSK